MVTPMFLIEECRCDPNLPDGAGRGPLFYAAQKDHLSTVEYLIVEHGCRLDSTDMYRITPLHLAAEHGHMEVVKFLTAYKNYKVITSLRNRDNDTPMHLAALYGHSDVVEYFITVMQCSPHFPGQYERSPLHHASSKGHLHLIKNLINKHRCDSTILDENTSAPCSSIWISLCHTTSNTGHLDFFIVCSLFRR